MLLSYCIVQQFLSLTNKFHQDINKLFLQRLLLKTARVRQDVRPCFIFFVQLSCEGVVKVLKAALPRQGSLRH